MTLDPTSSRRRSGILLHPTSLPGPFDVGDLGESVDVFLDWLEEAGQTVWQVLPLGPPALNATPYTCYSAFAGNPALISPQRLVVDGWLKQTDLEGAPAFDVGRYDLGKADSWKEGLLRLAWDRFRSRRGSGSGSDRDPARQDFEAFCQDPAQAPWLDDWALFQALLERFGGRPWSSWDEPLARRQPEALARLRRQLGPSLDFHRWVQFVFFRQWDRVRREAARRGIGILGDLPIYVALESADVWAHRHLFDLDPAGRPLHVAGVPPDYFCETGQLWGNPLYRWDRMAEEGFRWWIARVKANLRLADGVRLDHFRAFVDYWQVPADEPTAENGRWQVGPGEAFFVALADALGALPLVAEDLGDLSDSVHELRKKLGLPGIRVLHFGFDDEPSLHSPQQLDEDCVVYTGTHDNDTTVGWYTSLSAEERQRVDLALDCGDLGVSRCLIEEALASKARLALIPAQDVLGLGTEARMNIPGTAEGNWLWRLGSMEPLTPQLAEWLRARVEVSGRLGEKPSATGDRAGDRAAASVLGSVRLDR